MGGETFSWQEKHIFFFSCFVYTNHDVDSKYNVVDSVHISIPDADDFWWLTLQTTCLKNCGKMRNLSTGAKSPFPTMFLNSIIPPMFKQEGHDTGLLTWVMPTTITHSVVR